MAFANHATARATRYQSWRYTSGPVGSEALAIPTHLATTATVLCFLATPYFLFHSFIIAFLASLGASALTVIFTGPLLTIAGMSALHLDREHPEEREYALIAAIIDAGALAMVAIAVKMAWDAP